ncbi:MAG: lytic murein transglycosylase [Mycobacteriaceae bacterium]|nr:lytic murein transglycosylase [Mycobacteriaceae bacterium]
MFAGWGARPAIAAARQRIGIVTRTPALRMAVIMPMVLICGIGATAPPVTQKATGTQAAVIPMAAVMPHTPAEAAGPAVVTAKRLPTNLHIAIGPTSAPQPPLLLSAPGPLGIPTIALSAYRNAEQKMAVSDPGCGVSWNLLAGIGRIESMHANFGATDARGTPVRPIFGPALDGTLPGNEVVVASSTGGQLTYARAMGPMQFLPGTWARYAADGEGDGISDPQNLYDSTLAAAQYLCSGGLNLREPSQVMTAVLRYNNSMPYARNVLGWAAAYATGVFPVDLPPLVGPPPPLGDIHLERPEGLGPDLPFNVNGLPFTDPMARLSLIDFGPTALPNQPPQLSWLAPAQAPACTLICIDQQIPQELPAEDTANDVAPNPVN